MEVALWHYWHTALVSWVDGVGICTTIASTDIGILLRDDVFVDFFNTFLNLPVFGQTPIYISSMGQWELWPELPSHLDLSSPALLAWLEKHRLPHFCKSSLCLHLILCQKLLGFIRSGEAAKLLNWQSADRWLLEKCISGSQGMWCFRAFLQGMTGEELTDFWLTTERLLGLDESDEGQRDLYLSLLHRLKATHLREGSSVITLCRTFIGSLLKFRHIQPTSTRREILSKMQEQALFMIQSYWLPKFFIHCKMRMEEEESCRPVLQEYRERLFQTSSQEPSRFLENPFTMHIKGSQGLSGPYCSKKAKAEIWTLVKEGRNSQEMKMPSFRVQPERQLGPAGSRKESHTRKDALRSIPQQWEHPANPAFGGKGGETSPKRPRQVLHLKGRCEEQVLPHLRPSAPLVQLPSLKKPVKTLSFLPWALSAETCAGRPFRDFLMCQDRPVETRLLDLWHDLEEFLPVALDPRRENSFFLRHLIGEKICKTYLEESTIQHLPLETRTLRSLRNHLMSGEFSPWIFRAQKEICEVLCCFYEEFLANDDRTFLQFMHERLASTLGEEGMQPFRLAYLSQKAAALAGKPFSGLPKGPTACPWYIPVADRRGPALSSCMAQHSMQLAPQARCRSSTADESPQRDVLVPEMRGHAVGNDECFLLSQRINQSLKLSQALHGTRNVEGLSSKHWRLIATQDFRKGGSVQAEVKPHLCSTVPQRTAVLLTGHGHHGYQRYQIPHPYIGLGHQIKWKLHFVFSHHLLRMTSIFWASAGAESESSHLQQPLDSQKMMSSELAVDGTSKEKEPVCLKSPPLDAEEFGPHGGEEFPQHLVSPDPGSPCRHQQGGSGVLCPVDSSVEPKTKNGTVPTRKAKLSTTKSTAVAVEKPSRRPRHFMKVLHNLAHLQFFRQFLKERNAAKPLHFWMAVEKLGAETNPKTKSLLINRIVRNYFRAKIPAEEQLDCHTSIIEEINDAEVVSPFMLATAQIFVQKAMEKRWFKEYQDLFPPRATHKSNLRLQRGIRNIVSDKRVRKDSLCWQAEDVVQARRRKCCGSGGAHMGGQWAWCVIHDIVKSIGKFRREMDNDKHCAEFEDFLRQELRNKEEGDEVQNFAPATYTHTHSCNNWFSAEALNEAKVTQARNKWTRFPVQQGGELWSDLPKDVDPESLHTGLPVGSRQNSSTVSICHSHTASAGTPLDKEGVLVRRHLFNNQLVTINFLVDDLRFYLEIEKFSRLADSVEALAARNMQSEKEVAFLKKKVAIISKLFLNSDVPPKLRVNISREERDLIWSLSSKGLLNRMLYHRAKVTIFPILMHFWRRFCTWKVMRSFRVSTKDREPISLPSRKSCSKSSNIYSPMNAPGTTLADPQCPWCVMGRDACSPSPHPSCPGLLGWHLQPGWEGQVPWNAVLLLGRATHAGTKPRAHLYVGAAVHAPVPVSPNAFCHQGHLNPAQTQGGRCHAPTLQPPKSFAVKGIWVTHALAQPSFLDLCTSPVGFKGDNTSRRPPSFAIRALATQYCFLSSPSPGGHAVIVFTLLKGIQILLPQPQKMELLEKQEGEPVLKGSFLPQVLGWELGSRAPCTSP
ncbi:regulator of G-protein signaling protein-like [Rhynochetos jubatus]